MVTHADSPSLDTGDMPAVGDARAATGSPSPAATPVPASVTHRSAPDRSTRVKDPNVAAPPGGWGDNAVPDKSYWADRSRSDTGVRLGARNEVFLSRRGVASLFRLPGANDPAPASGRMIGLCGWATALGLAGLAVALRGLVAIIAGTAPFWYEPVVISLGLLGILLTVAGFLSIQWRRVPWVLLAAATVPLLISVGLAIAVL